jgi:hypothetical protein
MTPGSVRWCHRASLYEIHAARDLPNTLVALLDATDTLAKGLGGQLEVEIVTDEIRFPETAAADGVRALRDPD